MSEQQPKEETYKQSWLGGLIKREITITDNNEGGFIDARVKLLGFITIQATGPMQLAPFHQETPDTWGLVNMYGEDE